MTVVLASDCRIFGKFLAKWLLNGDSEENKKVRITANLLAIGLVGLGGLEPPTSSLSVEISGAVGMLSREDEIMSDDFVE